MFNCAGFMIIVHEISQYKLLDWITCGSTRWC